MEDPTSLVTMLLDTETGKERLRFRRNRSVLGPFLFSPDGKVIACESERQNLCLWDARTGRLLHQLRPSALEPSQVAFSADSKLFAHTAATQECEIVVLEVASGKEVHR